MWTKAFKLQKKMQKHNKRILTGDHMSHTLYFKSL